MGVGGTVSCQSFFGGLRVKKGTLPPFSHLNERCKTEKTPDGLPDDRQNGLSHDYPCRRSKPIVQPSTPLSTNHGDLHSPHHSGVLTSLDHRFLIPVSLFYVVDLETLLHHSKNPLIL